MDDLTSRLRSTFVEELDEQVRQLNDGLIALEQSPGNAEVIRTLFRSAHTVKGAARVAGVPEVEEICHAMESVFVLVREGKRNLSGSDFSLLFAVCDALEDAGARLRRDEPLSDAAIRPLLPRVQALTGGPAPGGGGASAAAAGPRPPRETPLKEQEAAPGQTSAPAKGDRTEGGLADGRTDQVRVRADRLEELLGSVGELLVATGRVVQRADRGDPDARRLDLATDAVADVVRRLRLRAFGEVVEGLPRTVRDIAAAEKKEVVLTIEGTDVEADRKVIDALRDPVLHLVRNAVDHGIELPAERVRAGKATEGQVHVGAAILAGRLVVTVSDDGSGLDEQALLRSAREQGLQVADVADTLLAGGVSTRQEATEISGRGVGMDIVRSTMERIGGGVDVQWRPGQGTTFTLECPPTPSSLRAVLLRLGPHTFAIPTAHVERLRRIRTTELKRAGGRTVLQTARGPVQLTSLAALLGAPLEARPLEDTATVIIVSAGSRRAALVVDEVLDEDEIVVRPVRAEDGAVPHAAGAAILPSGTAALVLAAPALLASVHGQGIVVQQAERERPRRRVLVADDSITTRTLEQSVLEAAGYSVLTAVDGEDAWQTLQREGADAIVADVEMPRMDGFALCRRIRASERFNALPIVLVTGLASPEDRSRGLDAGADAYIVKSSFDQATLLDTINQLIGDE
jgi:two-component system, chemotaxis family, sensor kinase CheA